MINDVMNDSELSPDRFNSVGMIRDLLFFFCLGVFFIRTNLIIVSLWRQTFDWFETIALNVDNLYYNDIQNILIICIIITFFITKPSLLRILFSLFLIQIGYKVSMVQGDIYFYLGVLFIVAAHHISAKRILVFFLSINVPLLFVTVLLSKIGCLDNVIELGRNREYLGYTWTTTPVMLFAYSVFAYLVLKRGKISIIDFLIINLINYWLFLKTNTKFTFLIVFLIVLFFALMELIKTVRIPLMERNIIIIAPWLFFMLIYCVSVAYNPDFEIMRKLNRLLSNRLKQCEYSLRLYDILPFGQPIAWVTTMNSTDNNPATYVDTAYLQILLKLGVFAIVSLLLICSYIVYRSYKEKKYYVALVLGFIMIFGLFEQQMLYFQYNILLMLAFADWGKLLPDKSQF